MSQIGIKLANHDFFPIINDISSLPIEKEVELTTVRDAQSTVQINLFRKDEGEVMDYIGTLVIEDLKDTTCEDASILLSLHLDKEKNLKAQAVDKNTGNKQSFSISIENLKQSNLADFDFDMEDSSLKDIDNFSVDDIDLSFTDIPLGEDEAGDEERLEDGEQDEYEDAIQDNVILDEELSPSIASQDMEEEPTIKEESLNEKKEAPLDEDYLASLSMYEPKKAFPTWLKIFLVVLIMCILALVVAIFLKDTFRRPKKTSNVRNIEKIEKKEEVSLEDTHTIDTLTTEPPKKESEPFLQEEKKESNVKIDEEEESSELSREENKVSDEKSVVKNDMIQEATHEEVKKVESGAISSSVRYKLRFGDTLWDLSENFYKNPWQYKKIARYNGIKNPSRIIAGRYITIPAK